MRISGDEIRDARERARLTQQELGARVGVSLRTIGNWERGESVPKSRMGALVEVLDVHAEPDSDQPLPKGGLQYLIQDRKGDLSMDRLAKRCGLTSKSAGRNLHKLAYRNFSAFPDPETLAGLARGLRVPLADVLLATAVSVGIGTLRDTSDDLVIPNGGKLPSDAKEALVTMAEALIDAHSRPWGDEPAATEPTQAGYDLAANKGHAGIDPEETEANP